jgi:hypothetical protein
VASNTIREQRGVPAGISAEISWAEAVDEIHPHPHPVALRRADALVRMAQAYSDEAFGNSGDRFIVHVHTDKENLVLLCRHHHRLVHEGGFRVCKSTLGVIEFSNPASKIIPTSPARNSRGNAWSLFEQHSESGIHITPKTAQSLWLGEKMDDDLAVLGMLQLE